MKIFYPKLALTGIRKNKKMYLPYMMTIAGMAMMTYIFAYLIYNEALSVISGYQSARSILRLGNGVIVFFAAIFLFYTTSFLMRQRKKEFGLYNILGMGKRNIARILLWESGIVWGGSVLIGMFLGVLFSKLAELGFIKLLAGDVLYDLRISGKAVAWVMIVYGVLFALNLLNSLRQVHFSGAIELLRSENVGEKAPKANWILAVLGAVLLAGAYYLALTVGNAIEAFTYFFAAVLMVIAATYLLMISGSVSLCRLLQKNKRFYYRPRHFVSVSSMAYRMKRNGAGLASICILATMVLVMTSTTTALLVSVEDILDTRYPRDISVSVDIALSPQEDKNASKGSSPEDRLSKEALRPYLTTIEDEVHRFGGNTKNLYCYRNLRLYTSGEGEGRFYPASYTSSLLLDDSSVNLLLIPLEDYNEIFQEKEELTADQVMVFSLRVPEPLMPVTSFRMGEDLEFSVTKRIPELKIGGGWNVYSDPTLVVIVKDLSVAETIWAVSKEGDDRIGAGVEYFFDTNLSKEDEEALAEERIPDAICHNEDLSFSRMVTETKKILRDEYYGLYGGMFYLGAMLSLMFVFAAVLIIYYKQVTEGYEDKSRFEIMQKVGMTTKEIKRSINSQILTVFLLPLGAAGVHLLFAFPMIQKILLLMNLRDVRLFVITTIISYVVFAVLYVIVYRITSHSYYQIVSRRSGKESSV